MFAQLKVTLEYTRPLVWRRLVVPHDITLPRLHKALQCAFDWDDAHFHHFEFGETLIVDKKASPDFFDDPYSPRPVVDERKYKLFDFLRQPKQKLIYTYDFGDDWRHLIVLEKLLPPEALPGKRIVRCLAGANAAPPEDCGGPPGFEHLKIVFADPNHPEREEMTEWLGDDRFDPTEFDLALVNDDLASLRV